METNLYSLIGKIYDYLEVKSGRNKKSKKEDNTNVMTFDK